MTDQEAQAEQDEDRGADRTPRELVQELDRYVIGQARAKRAVAVSLRDRWRRQQITDRLRDEITPKNIIMIGPTGVGKTEIARRLARLARAPFVKVEASKFTEVGYVGRDVESVIRDLVEVAIKLVREEELERVQDRARELAEERMLDLLLPSRRPDYEEQGVAGGGAGGGEEDTSSSTREKLRKLLREGFLDDREVEIELDESNAPMMEVFSNSGIEDLGINLKDSLGQLFPKKSKTRRLPVHEAMELLVHEEGQKLVDDDKVTQEALERAQENGIVFLDELDKVSGGQGGGDNPDVSREGVQRDLLPIVEGSTVNTKHGMVRTDHILFLAAGAFQSTSVSDLIPELQGRFPIRVELDNLGEQDFIRILEEPENSLIRQYHALLGVEGVELDFGHDAIQEIARIAQHVNDRQENIGARRLHTVMERLLEDVSFEAPDMEQRELRVDADFVRERLDDILEDPHLEHYIL